MFRLFCIAVLVLLSVIDIVSLTVPDAAVVMLVCAALIWIPADSLISAVPAAVAVLGVCFLTALLCRALKRPAPFGMGDAKLLSALSLGLCATELMQLIAAAGVLAGVYAALLLALKKAGPKSQIPFVPFIAAGYALAVLPGVAL